MFHPSGDKAVGDEIAEWCNQLMQQYIASLSKAGATTKELTWPVKCILIISGFSRFLGLNIPFGSAYLNSSHHWLDVRVSWLWSSKSGTDSAVSTHIHTQLSWSALEQYGTASCCRLILFRHLFFLTTQIISVKKKSLQYQLSASV